MKTMWNELCKLLRPSDESLLNDIRLSIDMPDVYFEQFSDALLERGIEDSSGVDPWLALVDGLGSRGHLREFDWKMEADEVAFQLEKLRPCLDRLAKLPETRSSGVTGEKLLHIAAEELVTHSLTLLHLEIDGDCYPVAVVSSENASEIIRLTSFLRRTTKIYGARI